MARSNNSICVGDSVDGSMLWLLRMSFVVISIEIEWVTGGDWLVPNGALACRATCDE